MKCVQLLKYGWADIESHITIAHMAEEEVAEICLSGEDDHSFAVVVLIAEVPVFTIFCDPPLATKDKVTGTFKQWWLMMMFLLLHHSLLRTFSGFCGIYIEQLAIVSYVCSGLDRKSK